MIQNVKMYFPSKQMMLNCYVIVFQIYSPTKNVVHLIDIAADTSFLEKNGHLAQILESSKIVKVSIMGIYVYSNC